jgi:hypothetical protein
MSPSRVSLLLSGFTLIAAAAVGSVAAQEWTDTVQAGRFDNGKMWTFEAPPMDYFQEAYGIQPDAAWFERARLGALRVPGCSASFVSAEGLVMTNHHCARGSVSNVAESGETLLDDGFYAAALEDERRIEDYYADQLVDIRDVTGQVNDAVAAAGEDAQVRASAREGALEEIQTAILEEFGGEDGGHVVEVISLYNGGRTSAYVFRRFGDVRLVFAPELQIGFFGGDPDNFTYPRYNLDMSFYRIYEDGAPYRPEVFFPFSNEGVSEGDPVFVIGNPGSTSRLQTVAELEFRRDVSDKAVLDFIDSRVEVLGAFIAAEPEVAESLDLRNSYFGLANSQKAYGGQIKGLHDPYIIARRAVQEAEFQAALASDSVLSAEYGGLIERMAEIQDRKRGYAAEYAAFLGATAPEYGSATLVRALYAFQLLASRSGGAPEEALEELRSELEAVPQLPESLEADLIEARLADFERAWGEDSPVVQNILQGRTPEGFTAFLLSSSALADSASAVEAIETGELRMTDPAIAVIQGILPRIGAFQAAMAQFAPEEEEISASLGRARYEIYGVAVPPDATFSLRIADGVVAGYEYNGTQAPAFTTFWGLFDRHFSHRGMDDWALPDRWLQAQSALDLNTPLNFVSTVDIIGGNSGSPTLNADLEVVGLIFDGNIESLPGDYIYLDEVARSVAVDARGIVEALESVYGADRLVEELGAAVPAGR